MSTRKQISLTDPVARRAAALIRKRDLNGLSHLLATLVHEEYDRRFPETFSSAKTWNAAEQIAAAALNDSPAGAPPPPVPASAGHERARYPKAKRPPRKRKPKNGSA